MLALRKGPRHLWLTTAFRERCFSSSDKVKPKVLKQLEEGYAQLSASKSNSLLKKHLTKEIFDKLKTKVTPSFNSTLLDCIRSGLCNQDSGVGIYAPDPEAYKVFADLFDPIIQDYHGGFKKTDKHPASCFGHGSDFEDLDPDNQFIVSTRVRCARSVKCFAFNPCLSMYDYNELEEIIAKVLNTLSGLFSGKYLSLACMAKKKQKKLIDQHYLFKEGDRFLEAANATRFWPAGRGIFLNSAKNFLVWVNEEDHIRIISMEKGGNLGNVYERMILGVEALSKHLQFSHDERLGYLTFCPTNLGTSVRASVHIKLPMLTKKKDEMNNIAKKYNLQIRGTHGEHTEAAGGVHDISNKRRLGLTEYEALSEMHKGIRALIDAECAEISKSRM